MHKANKIKLQKRARSKYFTNKMAIPLAALESSLKKSYWNTYHCNSILMEHNGKLTGSYCKNRWCLVCNRIRIAHLINGYKPQVEKLKDPYFVTLTARTVNGEDLSKRIDDMLSKWRRIYKNAKQYKRKIIGLRKLECTVRPDGKYHPHFHFIIDGKENSEWVIDKWLKQWLELSERKGQDIRKADEKSLQELFKYFTKLTVKTEKPNMFNPKTKRTIIHPERLDVIFQAMRRRQVYSPLGGLKKIEEEVEEKSKIDIEAGALFKWIENDWVEANTGEYLSGWIPSKELEKINFEEKD